MCSKWSHNKVRTPYLHSCSKSVPGSGQVLIFYVFFFFFYFLKLLKTWRYLCKSCIIWIVFVVENYNHSSVRQWSKLLVFFAGSLGFSPTKALPIFSFRQRIIPWPTHTHVYRPMACFPPLQCSIRAFCKYLDLSGAEEHKNSSQNAALSSHWPDLCHLIRKRENLTLHMLQHHLTWSLHRVNTYRL